MGAGDIPREVLREPTTGSDSVGVGDATLFPRVRDATPADSAALARLCGQLGYPTSAEDMPARLARLATDPNIRVLVAENEHGVVGLAAMHVRHMINHEAPLAQLTTLVVDERCRGRGVGRALVDVVERFARERPCKRLVVNTALRRTDAHAFYEKLGFTHTGRRYGKDFL
jgi:ribosomal protein S18 acetylase RimI-like enzyme